MKQSELKQLIREEIFNTMSKGLDNDIFKKHLTKYISQATQSGDSNLDILNAIEQWIQEINPEDDSLKLRK